MRKKLIKIGTRNSDLALWQAKRVQKGLQKQGIESELVFIQSVGDQNKKAPLHELGEMGAFTKALDKALQQGIIDLAVHSMKDAATRFVEDVVPLAVLERESASDVFIPGPGTRNLEVEAVVATGSLRRRAQWLRRYPDDKIVNLRGNMGHRLEKLCSSTWKGAIFAKAALVRLNKLPFEAMTLDWMLPAPAQGAILVVGSEARKDIFAQVRSLNDPITELCTGIEREFLQTLEGGCSAPIGAYAFAVAEKIHFIGGLFSLEGEQAVVQKEQVLITEHQGLGRKMAEQVLSLGGEAIIATIRKAFNR